MNKGKEKRHTGRFSQMIIYLGKLFRMFIFQNDWKVLPMAAVIAGLVSFATGENLFKTMEGTFMGTFALSCVCIWNGFFNSIQVICRERSIVKREHRSGLHISSYIAAHMLYQAVLCISQAIITILVCKYTGVAFPEKALLTPWPLFDIGITLFLITYCADMLALMISAFSHTTTAAMTIMPFLLIVQLVFAGAFIPLPEKAMPLTNMTIAKWGMTALCSQGDYNSKPMTSIWNNAFKMKDLEIEGEKPVWELLVYVEQNGMKEEFMLKTAENNQNPEYTFDPEIPLRCWRWLILWTVIYVAVATIPLEFIDRDKR